MVNGFWELVLNYLSSLILTQDTRQTELPVLPWLRLMPHRTPRRGEGLFALQLQVISCLEPPLFFAPLGGGTGTASLWWCGSALSIHVVSLL